MNRIRNKLAAGFLTLAVMAAVFVGGAFSSFAATGKITFSDPSVTVGNQVSVTMKIATADGNLGSSDVMVTYDASALEFVSGTSANGGAGQIRVVGSMESTNQKTFSFTLKFKALKAGSTTLSIASQEVYDADSQTVSITHLGSSTVTVHAPQGASSNASLASLTISPGELSPAFSADVTEYTAVISGSSLAVSAPAADSNATVSVSGNAGLQNGENTVICKVTAEDGTTTKSYTITVTVTEGGAEAGDETESVPASAEEEDAVSWTVAQSFDESLLPDGFTVTETEYNGQTVQAGIDANGFLLLYMIDEDGNGDFFYYDTESGSVSPYVTVLMAEKTIVVLPESAIPEGTSLPEGFVYCTIDIGTHTVDGWVWGDGSETPEYCVVYGMNADGERSFYRYDQKEMTLQRFFTDPDAADTKAKLTELGEEYNSLVKDFNTRGILIAVLFGVCILLIILLIILLLTRKPRGGGRYVYEAEYERGTPESRGNRGETGRGRSGRANTQESRSAYAGEDSAVGGRGSWSADESAGSGAGRQVRRSAADRAGSGVGHPGSAGVSEGARYAVRGRERYTGDEELEVEDLDLEDLTPASDVEADVREAAGPAQAAASGGKSASAAVTTAPQNGGSVPADDLDDDFEFIDLDI